MKKLIAIEFLRFLFMLIIVLWHFGRINPFSHGYIAVDFFFILSGLFLYKSYSKNTDRDAYSYTQHRLRRFYLEYLIVFLISFVLKSKIWLKGGDITSTIVHSISEICLLHSIGLFQSGINPPTWYISVLLVGGFFLYAMLNINSNTTLKFWLPLLVLCTYTLIFNDNQAKGSLEVFNVHGCIAMPLLRAIAGMGVGVLLAYVNTRLHSTIEKHVSFLNFAVLGAVVLICLQLFGTFYYDSYCIIAFCVLIIAGITERTWLTCLFNSPLWTKLGGVTYEMLLIHAPVIWVIDYMISDIVLPVYGKFLLALIYVVITVGLSFLLKEFSHRISEAINNKYEVKN